MCVHAFTLATTNTHQGLVMRLLYIRTYVRMFQHCLRMLVLHTLLGVETLPVFREVAALHSDHCIVDKLHTTQNEEKMSLAERLPHQLRPWGKGFASTQD